MKVFQRLIYRFRNVTPPATESPLPPDYEIDFPEPRTRSFAATVREWSISLKLANANPPAIHELVPLAQALGSADAAIVVWTFQKWIAANKARKREYHFQEGRWWIYTSIAHLSVDHFPWISETKMAKLLIQLDKDGVLLRARFALNIAGTDARYWYSVDEEAVARRIKEKTVSPDPSRRIFYGDALPPGLQEREDTPLGPADYYIDERLTLDFIPKRSRQTQFGYVYLLKATNGLHKIGLSKDAERRLKDFENLPFGVEYICVIESEDMRGLESSLHKRFAAKRVRGEWFDLDAEDVDYIRSLTLEGF
jgi:hypothetical protein